MKKPRALWCRAFRGAQTLIIKAITEEELIKEKSKMAVIEKRLAISVMVSL